MNKQTFQKLAKIHSQKPVIMGYENGKRFYEFDGHKFASVTTALSATKPQKDIDALNNWRARVGEIEAARISKETAERGSEMHDLAERYLKADHAAIDVRCDSVRLFEQLIPELNNIDWWDLELFVCSKKLWLAGRLDCLGFHGDQLTLIDFKTSKKKKDPLYITDYYCQVTIYAMMCEELFGLEIKKGLILVSTMADGLQKFEFEIDVWREKVLERVRLFHEK
jgi:genome maintenance exonuclease 1